MAYFSVKQLEHIVQNASLQDLFRIDESLSEGEKFSVRAKIDPEQEKNLQENFAIDTDAMVRNMLVNEAFMSMVKALFKNIEDASEIQDPFSFNTLITSTRVGHLFQEDEMFQGDPFDAAPVVTMGFYRVGKIGETSIFINPHISWSQTHSLVLDLKDPVTFNLEDDDTETHRGVILKLKMPENMKAFVWNCPQEMLDKL